MDRVLVKEMTVEPRTDSDLNIEHDELHSDRRVHCKAEGDNVFSARIWSGSVADGGAHRVFLAETTIRMQNPFRFPWLPRPSCFFFF